MGCHGKAVRGGNDRFSAEEIIPWRKKIKYSPECAALSRERCSDGFYPCSVNDEAWLKPDASCQSNREHHMASIGCCRMLADLRGAFTLHVHCLAVCDGSLPSAWQHPCWGGGE